MLRRFLLPALGAVLFAAPAHAAGVPVSLRGSPASMVHQNAVAKESDYTFLATPAQVRAFATEGRLVRLEGGAGYGLARGVSFPYVRPETRLFVERLGAQHRAACGSDVVVTSATRPLSGQPSNAHLLSVHPTGMAVDLRVSSNAKCRRWLEGTLLSLERKGLLDVTREQRPPHFHVAVFPKEYRAFVQEQDAGAFDVVDAAAADESLSVAAGAAPPQTDEVVAEPVVIATPGVEERGMPFGGAAAKANAAHRARTDDDDTAAVAVIVALLAIGIPVLVRRRRAAAEAHAG
jgi:hypothetical protein